ncbi:hypothetical protein LEMLEM_LOCUS10252, partial [Lemmus lemmus]
MKIQGSQMDSICKIITKVQETQQERRWKECERQSCEHCPLDSHGHCTDEISGCGYLTRSSPSTAQHGW